MVGLTTLEYMYTYVTDDDENDNGSNERYIERFIYARVRTFTSTIKYIPVYDETKLCYAHAKT